MQRRRRGISQRVQLVFSGGIGLGAYQAGVYEALHARADVEADWMAASSVGAVNAVLIAGAPAHQRLERLREFWLEPAWALHRYLRRLLIHGARSCIMHLDRSRDRLGAWLQQLQSRMHVNKVTVALRPKLLGSPG
jgi:predicted acylesterase/phospholipase RssA